MKDKKLKGYLQQSLGEEVQPKRLEETIKLCTEIVREQEVTRAEPRTGFFHYLSDVFRFEGIPIFGLQAVTLFGHQKLLLPLQSRSSHNTDF